MKYRVQNTRILTPDELLSILSKSAKLYSEYVDATLLFIFRKKKSGAYDYYEVRFGKNNFMNLAGIKSEASRLKMIDNKKKKWHYFVIISF